jgi:hypothetical protein
MKDILTYNRMNLLMAITDMGFSQSTKHDIMLLFGVLKTNLQKEEVAKRAIPLVKKCKTEKEGIEIIRKVIEQFLGYNKF